MPILASNRQTADGWMIDALQRLAINHGLINGDDLAINCGADDRRAEFFADEDFAIEELDAFQIEISTRQIAFGGAFMSDAAQHLAVRIAQEDGLLDFRSAGFEIRRDLVEIKKRVAAVGLRAEAIVSECVNRTIIGLVHRKAGKTLQRLTVKRNRKAGGALAMHAACITGNGIYRINPCRAREFAGNLGIGRRIARSRYKACSRQNRVTGQFGGIGFLGLRSAKRRRNGDCGNGQFQHGITPGKCGWGEGQTLLEKRIDSAVTVPRRFDDAGRIANQPAFDYSGASKNMAVKQKDRIEA